MSSCESFPGRPPAAERPVSHAILLAEAAGAEASPELRPDWSATLVDRPLAQHVLEALAQQGVRTVDVIGSVAQCQRSRWMQDADRWGCQVRWRPIDSPAESLAAAARTPAQGRVLLGRLDTLPLPLPLPPLDGLPDRSALVVEWCDLQRRPTGWMLMEAEALETLPEDESELGCWLDALQARRLFVDSVVRGDSLELLLASQAALLEREFPFIQMTGRWRAAGVRVGRRVKIHPSAVVQGPAFLGDCAWIGPRVVIGPNAVIGADCIVDRDAVVRGSLVEPDTYIGPGVELLDSLACRGRVVNARLRAAVTLDDPLVISAT